MRKDARIEQAKRLRKSMTKPEIWLWAALKSQHASGLVFRRQHAVGPCILDFYCVKARLAIEVDGEFHTWNGRPERDAERDGWLETRGIRVHRIVARDLLMSPDETVTGIIDLTVERMVELGISLPSLASLAPPFPTTELP